MRAPYRLACVASTIVAAGFAVTAEAASADPFSRLFLTPPQTVNGLARGSSKAAPMVSAGVASPGAATTAAPRVVCGTTVVPVAPAFDAKMRRPAPRDPKPSARTAPAPSCQSSK